MKDLLIELMGKEKFRDPEEQRRYLETLLDEAFPEDPDNPLAATTINTMWGFSVKSGSGRHGNYLGYPHICLWRIPTGRIGWATEFASQQARGRDR